MVTLCVWMYEAVPSVYDFWATLQKIISVLTLIPPVRKYYIINTKSNAVSISLRESSENKSLMIHIINSNNFDLTKIS